eukprot:129413_1
MTNELQDFLSLLRRIILFIIRWTANIICFCISIMSLFGIWRTVWILYDIFDDFTWSKFRRKSIVHFILVINDITLIPFAIFSLLMPTRSYHVVKNAYKTHKDFYTQYDDGYLYN